MTNRNQDQEIVSNLSKNISYKEESKQKQKIEIADKPCTEAAPAASENELLRSFGSDFKIAPTAQ